MGVSVGSAKANGVATNTQENERLSKSVVAVHGRNKLCNLTTPTNKKSAY